MPRKRAILDVVKRWNEGSEDVAALPLHNTRDPISGTPGVDRPYLMGTLINLPMITTEYGEGPLLKISRLDGTDETWGCPTRLHMGLSGVKPGQLVAIFPLGMKRMANGNAYDFAIFECRNPKDLPIESDFSENGDEQ